jgi:putative redox protein
MSSIARRRQGLLHEVEIEGTHTIQMDEPVEAGGTDAGPSPTRLLAGSLAGCIAITLVMYAERKGWDVGDIEVEVETQYEGPNPKSFAATVRLPAGLDDEQRQRLLTIARKCPVHKVLAAETPVSVEVRSKPL